MSDSDSDWLEEDDAEVAASSPDEAASPAPPPTRAKSTTKDVCCNSLVVLLLDEEPVSNAILKVEATACCKKSCFVGMRDSLKNLLSSLQVMTKDEQRSSLMTSLAMCAAFAGKRSADKERERFYYYLPYVGQVCKSEFETVYKVSHRTLHVYRKRLRDRDMMVKCHGNVDNTNARLIDEDLLVNCFCEFAKVAGDVVPVCGRLKKDRTMRRFYSFDNYMLLPSHFTWEALASEYTTYLSDNELDSPQPPLTSFTRILSKCCPTIKIRSARDQVCDQCTIYRHKLAPEGDAIEAEVLGDHLMNPKR